MDTASHATLSVTCTDRGVATVELNRPDRGNALNRQLRTELSAVLAACAADDRVRLLLLRGAGRHFCAGADVDERGDPPGGSPTGPTLPELLAEFDAFPKPIMALIQGGCIGGGVAIAACSDVVLAVEGSFFSLPEIRLGLVPTSLLPYFLRLFGDRGFRRYGLSGERLGAAGAVRLGLAHELCPPEQAERIVGDLADALLHGAPLAMRELKGRLADRLGTAAVDPGPQSRSPEREAELREGLKAFAEKRKPFWYRPQPA